MPSPSPQNTCGLVGKLPCTLEDPAEGAGPLFHAQDENHIAPPESELEHTLWSPFLKRGLPIQRHCPQCPRDVAESSQPRQPYNIQSLKELWVDLIHPRGLATEEFFDYLGNFSPGDMRAYPQVPRPYFLTGRCRMVVQNLFEAVQKSLSVASPNSSHARVFASAIAVAALRLACRYLSAASGVPQARKARYDSFFSLTASLHHGGTEHGSLGLNVPCLPQDMVKALPEAKEGYPVIHWGKLQYTGTKLGSNQNCHSCPSPLTISNSRVVESPTPLEKTGSRALAVRQEPVYAAGDQTAKVVSPREEGPMLPLQAGAAGLHGQRSGHQVLANVPHLQAWLQEGAPVTRIQARETWHQCCLSSLEGHGLRFV
ncbi:hypothetical protein D4764_12G0007230 [Takifugu flavidus]|uniref:Uncharacterized protein n=1 Tax=Takifugu flavidus TaxID=433684 RepID=A0A5C6PD12_9TELE|nr:hypothetical protein D4764_12G0007230 [Takifugu flavidus]